MPPNNELVSGDYAIYAIPSLAHSLHYQGRTTKLFAQYRLDSAGMCTTE